jgi:hypothetical protein
MYLWRIAGNACIKSSCQHDHVYISLTEDGKVKTVKNTRNNREWEEKEKEMER